MREPLPQSYRKSPVRDCTLDNLAVVRTWWKVLENEWQAALSERAHGVSGFAMIDPRLHSAVRPFDEFDAVVDDLLAFGEQVVISVSLRGRIGRRELDAREAWVCLLEEGAVREVRQYGSVQEALLTVATPAAEESILAARL